MKIKIFSLFTTIVFMALALTLKSSAVQMPDMSTSGHAKIVIEEKNKKPETYNFSGDFPSGLKCLEDARSSPASTQIIMLQDFDKGNGSDTLVGVHLRIEPNGAGTFQLNPAHDSDPSGHVKIQRSGQNVERPLSDADDVSPKRTGGTIIIENYPKAVGGFIKGTFDVKLLDLKDNLVHVSGEFYIKRKSK
jgi:hypothetical protein